MIATREKGLAISVLHEALHYNPETGLLLWKWRPRHHFPTSGSWRAQNTTHAFRPAGSKDCRGVILVSVCKRVLRAHRIAWAMHYGEWPEQEIDHIDGNPSNNRIANLRDVSHKVNCRNYPLLKTNTSGCTGVWYSDEWNKWYAGISHNGRTIHLGSWKEKSKAIAARKDAEKRLGYHPNHGRA